MASEVLGRAVYVYEADTGPLEKSTAAAKRDVDRAGAQMQVSMDKRLGSMSKSMGKVGSEMTRNVTLPIVGLAGASIKMASDFQRAMEMVHTQAGASQKEVAVLSKQVLALSRVTGQGPTDLANALYRLEGAGYRGATAMKALRASADLAMVGNANVEDTTKTLTQVLKPGIKGIKDFHDAVGQINATVGAGDMRLQQLVDALGTGVVTSAKQAGLSFRDVRGALAVFGDETNNVSGWAAQFATALHFLTNPTNKAADALNGIGLKSDQLALDMQKPNGLVRALTDLQDHLDQTFPKGSGAALSIDQQRAAMDRYEATLKGMGVTGKSLSDDMDKYKKKLQDYGSAAVAQTQTLGDIFPGGRGRVLSVLLNQVNLLQQKLHQEDRTTGTISKSIAESQETMQVRMHKAWANIQVDAIELGTKLAPTFLNLASDVADDANKIANAFLKLPPDARQMIITGGLITAGIGPAMKIASVFLSGISKLVGVSNTAVKLAAGEKSLFGSTAGRTGATSGLSSVSRVATMEVGEMNVARMLGGAGGGSGIVGKAEKATVPVEDAAAGEVGLATMLKGALSRLAGGGMLAVGGVTAAQLAGHMVGGKVGSQISTAGTGASIGAGLGTAIEPGIGTAVGAGIGAGVAEAVKAIKGDDYGAKIADAIFTKGFGGAAGAQLRSQLAAELDKYNQLAQTKTSKNAQYLDPYTKKWVGQDKVPVGEDTVWKERFKVQGLSPQQIAKQAKAAQAAGQTVAKALEQGWSKTKFQSEPEMFQQFTAKAKQLPPQAQAAALESAVKFSKGLESNGQLVKGSTKQLISDVENQFPGLKKYLGLSAQSSVQTFAKALNFQNAENNTKQAMKKMAGNFEALQTTLDTTKGDTLTKAGAMAKALEGIVQNGTGPMRRQATKDLDQLRQSLTGDFQKMGQLTSSKMGDIKTSVQSGSQAAAKAAGRYWDQFKTVIQNAERAGAISVAQGNKIIGQQLASALKALGLSTKDADALAKQGWSVGAVASGISSAKQAGITKNQPYAKGGLVQIGRPGDTGRDTIPMTFGDQSYLVGSGEQAMILNRSQQQFLNARTADVGGLPGMFSKVNRPHYRASGGFIGKPMATGGDLSYGQLEGLWDQAGGPPSMAALMAAIAEAESGGNPRAANPSGASGLWQILGLPFPGDVWNPLENAKMAVSKYRSQGLGAWVTYTSGAYRQFLNGSVPATAAGAGGAGVSVPTLQVPHLKGDGAIAALAQGVLDRTTAAANKYLSGKAATVAGAGMGGGFSVPIGNAPLAVRRALGAAKSQLGKPYIWGGYGLSAPGEDCSGFVSTVLTAAGLAPGHMDTNALASWGVSGPGRFITVGDSISRGHAMMEIDGQFFESGGGQQYGAPNIHRDPGWDGLFEIMRHPPGLARGGVLGDFGEIDPRVLLARNPSLADNPRFRAYAGLTGATANKAKAEHKLTPKQTAYLKKHAKKTGGKHTPAKSHKPKGLRGGAGATGIAKSLQQGIIGRQGPFPFDTSDLGSIGDVLSRVLALDGGDSNGIGTGAGGDAQHMWDLINWYTGTIWPSEPSPNWDDIADPSNFVITTDQYGNQPDPSQFSISPRLNTVVQELTKAIGWQGEGVTDLQKVLALTSARGLPRFVADAIRRRVAMIAQVRKRVRENAELIRKYKAAVKRLQKKIKDTRERMTKGVLHLHPKTYQQRQENAVFHQAPYPNLSKTRPYPHAKNAKQRAANQLWEQHYQANRSWQSIHDLQYDSWRGQIQGWQKNVKGLNGKIKPLEKENTYLGGAPDKIGAGGELKTLRTQLGSKAGSDPIGMALGTASSSSGLYSLLDTIQNWRTSINGVGGDLAVQKQTLKGWQANLTGLGPGANDALQNAIQQATAATGDTGTGTGDTGGTTATDTTSSLDQIKAQLYDQLQQSGQVSALQSGAFSPLLTPTGSPTEWIKQAGLIGAIPPYGGSFATGGVVPGMAGEPRTIVAHGGERYLGVGNDQPEQPIVIQVHHHGQAQELMRFVDTRISVAGRASARKVSYGLPSRGGGR